MPVLRGLRRLLRVLEIEEEQRRAEMEAVVRDLRRLERGSAAAEARGREGRRLVTASATTGELADRLAGMEESRAALQAAAVLRPKIAEREIALDARRQEFLSKRIERKQTEAVIQRAETVEAIESERRAQREQDDWFLSKARRAANAKRARNDCGRRAMVSGEESLRRKE